MSDKGCTPLKEPVPVEELGKAFDTLKRVCGIHSALNDLPECEFRTALVVETQAILERSPFGLHADQNAHRRNDESSKLFKQLESLQLEVQGYRTQIESLERELAHSRDYHERWVKQANKEWWRLLPDTICVSETPPDDGKAGG